MGRVLILSGAGLSAESGIKTFRDHDGLWEGHNVMDVCSTEGWQRDRAYVTDFYDGLRKGLEDKYPNEAHKAIVALEARYPESIIHLTQNIDDLNERAGSERTIHLHGTLRDLRCEQCNTVWEIGFEAQGNAVCPQCQGSNVRHNVVMFGEAAPNYRLIWEAVNHCDGFVAIGTSGAVIDVVNIAREFSKSLLVNPKREPYKTSFGDFEASTEEFFTDFIQQTAVNGSEAMIQWIEQQLT